MNMRKLAERIFVFVKKEGATKARCILSDWEVLEIAVRAGNTEKTDSLRTIRLSLSVWNGERMATVTGNADSWKILSKKACEMARITTPDPFALLAPKELWPVNATGLLKKLDLCDTKTEPKFRDLVEWALAVERAALKVLGVTASESVGARYTKGSAAMFTSEGFATETLATNFLAGGNFIAISGEEMTSGYHYDSTRHFSDMTALEEIGRLGGEKAIRLIGAQPIPTGSMPIIFDRDVSGTIIECLAAGIDGEQVKGSKSFLKEKLGEKIFPANITVVDDPHLPRLSGSDIVDMDGVAKKRIEFISKGVLTSWALDMRSAAKLGLVSTGHADGFNNFYMENGDISREKLIAEIPYGLYVVEVAGAPNTVTGDYSVGAKGLLIENGILTRPVHGITIAGNILEMFKNIRPANDLEIGRYNSPTIRVDGMTVAGT